MRPLQLVPTTGCTVNGMVYCSGQIALIPETGELLDGDVDAQTHLVLKNLSAVLEAAGSGLNYVVKATVFLKRMDDFPKVNAIYAQYFGEHKPARACVEVSCLPKNVWMSKSMPLRSLPTLEPLIDTFARVGCKVSRRNTCYYLDIFVGQRFIRKAGRPI